MSSENLEFDYSENDLRKDQNWYLRKIHRRTFMLGLVGFAAAYRSADLGLANLVWGERKNEVAMLPEHKDTESEDLWLVAPGLGVQDSRGISSTLRTSLEIVAPVAYMQIADEGLSINALARLTDELCWERKVKRLKIFGNSMGSITGIQIANRINVPEVDCFIGDGSPYDIGDVKDETLTNLVKYFVEYLPPGFLTKFIGESINSTVRDPNNELSLFEQEKDAYRVTHSGVAPQVWADALVLLGNIDTDTYRQKINERADTAFVRPVDPTKDRVVRIPQANRRWNEQLYGNMGSLALDVTSHASPTQFPGQYNQAISEYLTGIKRRNSNTRLHRSTR